MRPFFRLTSGLILKRIHYQCVASCRYEYHKKFWHLHQRDFHRVCLTQQWPTTDAEKGSHLFQLKEIEIMALGDQFRLVYAQAGPTEGEMVLMVHGSPATHRGFENISEVLVKQGYQVVVPNFPGMGWSPLPSSGRYNFSPVEKLHILEGLLEALEFRKVLMLCGHSLGSHVILHLPLLPSLMAMCHSVCLMSSPGLRPHSVASPWPAKKLMFLTFYNLCQLPVLGPALTRWSHPRFEQFGLKGKTMEAQVNSIKEASWFNWPLLSSCAKTLREEKMPLLVFSGTSDHIVQQDISRELVSGLGISEDHVVSYGPSGRNKERFKDSVLQRAVWIEGGDHSLFTNRADVIGPEQADFIRAVKRRSESKNNKTS